MSYDFQPQNGGYGIDESSNGVHGEYPITSRNMDDMSQGNGNQEVSLLEWLNYLVPHLKLSAETSTEDLRACLVDGAVLCSILNTLCPGSIEIVHGSDFDGANVKRFLAAMDELGLPSFELSDLEQGSMTPVLQCLSTLRSAFDCGYSEEYNGSQTRKKWDLLDGESLEGIDCLREDVSTHRQHAVENGEETQSLQLGIKNIVIPEQLGEKFRGILLKHGGYADLSEASILEFINSYKFDNTSTQSLLDTLNQILQDSTHRKNEYIPNRVAYAMRKIMQVIELRMSNQANIVRNQNNLFKTREEKYQSKLKVLETLAVGTSEENEVVLDQLQRLKIEKQRLEESKKLEEKDVEIIRKEKEDCEIEISRLREELESTKRTHENWCVQLEEDAKEAKLELKKQLKKSELELVDSRKKVKELESFAESKSKRWRRKERTYQNFINIQNEALKELRRALESTKHEVLKNKRSCSEEFTYLGGRLKGLTDAAENYHVVLAENRKLYNEVQDLKGNIRVYCRIRPFLSGQSKKLTTVEYAGENGELVIANPSKQGTRRLFKFNKVFGPASTQEEVFLDTQPLIRSVLDGYNVCIFAYGQTGSGKTYTMSGPSISSTADWGVNYRALSDLFQISQIRKSSITYEVGVQMVEIYNEQVRDLLSNELSQKRLGIWNTAQPNGLAVPDASMHSVNSTEDVLELMHIGLMNRAVGATALNERSSRSHSVLTVHVRGSDTKTNTVLRGSLHLVDLAGSERVDRSEATGDRLREAQHINKSLSALGDVIFALAQKSSHVPYRNSKLTQVLQSSLGGQAKTLMFVQLNPDVESYSETVSTLKFAERVSGVELGTARSNKEGRDVRELLEQVATLKDVVTKKDEEIEHWKSNSNSVKHSAGPLRYGSASPIRRSMTTPRRSPRLTGAKGSAFSEKAASDNDNCSEYSESQHSSAADFGHRKECSVQPKIGDSSQNEDFELLGFGDADSEERLSDISDGGLSMGTETDGSICSVVEYTLFPEPSEKTKPESGLAESTKTQKTQATTSQPERTQSGTTEKANVPSKLPKPPQKLASMKSSRLSLPRTTPKVLSGANKKPTSIPGSSSPMASRSYSKRWQ